MPQPKKPRVVIVGAGFGGLWAARSLARHPVDVHVIDRNNYHTFLALLYQVAAAELEAEDIAYPVRSVFWNLPNIDFTLAYARLIDRKNKVVKTDAGDVPYDYLILASGSISHDFGIPGVKEHAFFLKTLEEGVALKNHIICCFEAAAQEPDEDRRRSLLTFVIVGGGATGVEYAGALSELIHGPLRKDYPTINFGLVRIILLEAADALVGSMPAEVREYTVQKLRTMGVDVRLNTKVAKIDPDSVELQIQERIASRTVVWSAGVKGEPLAGLSGIPVTPGDRVPVLPTLQITDSTDIYAIGDLAFISGNGKPLAQVAQVAIQSGIAAAQNILRHLAGQAPLPFRYHDRGSMITVGRNSAGVAIGSRTYTGFFAWILWLVIHLFNLIGFRNRMMVLINWAWDYLLYERAVRFVFPSEMPCGAKTPSCRSTATCPNRRQGQQ